MKLTKFEKEYLRFNQHEIIAFALIFSMLAIWATLYSHNIFYGVAILSGGYLIPTSIKWLILFLGRAHQKKIKLQQH